MTPEKPQPVLRVLPRGPHGLSRDQIVASQRARLLEAAIDAVAARGYVGTAVADIIARAGVSRRTFYELYEDRDACVAEAFEVATEGLVTRVQSADNPLRAYLKALAEEPTFARFFLLEAVAAGPDVLAAREQAHDALAAAIVPPRRRRRATGLGNAEGRAVLGAANEIAGTLSVHGRIGDLELVLPLLESLTVAATDRT
jgi:AcrR family transcriptional regulator